MARPQAGTVTSPCGWRARTAAAGMPPASFSASVSSMWHGDDMYAAQPNFGLVLDNLSLICVTTTVEAQPLSAVYPHAMLQASLDAPTTKPQAPGPRHAFDIEGHRAAHQRHVHNYSAPWAVSRGARLMRPCARYVRRRCFCAWFTWMCWMNMLSVSRPFTCGEPDVHASGKRCRSHLEQFQCLPSWDSAGAVKAPVARSTNYYMHRRTDEYESTITSSCTSPYMSRGVLLGPAQQLRPLIFTSLPSKPLQYQGFLGVAGALRARLRVALSVLQQAQQELARLGRPAALPGGGALVLGLPGAPHAGRRSGGRGSRACAPARPPGTSWPGSGPCRGSPSPPRASS